MKLCVAIDKNKTGVIGNRTNTYFALCNLPNLANGIVMMTILEWLGTVSNIDLGKLEECMNTRHKQLENYINPEKGITAHC